MLGWDLALQHPSRVFRSGGNWSPGGRAKRHRHLITAFLLAHFAGSASLTMRAQKPYAPLVTSDRVLQITHGAITFQWYYSGKWMSVSDPARSTPSSVLNLDKHPSPLQIRLDCLVVSSKLGSSLVAEESELLQRQQQQTRSSIR